MRFAQCSGRLARASGKCTLVGDADAVGGASQSQQYIIRDTAPVQCGAGPRGGQVIAGVVWISRHVGVVQASQDSVRLVQQSRAQLGGHRLPRIVDGPPQTTKTAVLFPSAPSPRQRAAGYREFETDGQGNSSFVLRGGAADCSVPTVADARRPEKTRPTVKAIHS